ncbi:hypothetical protein DH2020_045903 [Rehmannia glutinosa]|uniref:Reverse transcriptase Ty1/copia-type domain-containing protein n=1 Tax=Rehmannia glutinosa TaxID=99300 RepID=A0ABR0UDG1_REHGL
MLKSIRILLAIASSLDYEIWQIDVKTTFLNGNLEEDIYMWQPEGFTTKGQEHMLCELHKSIYGLKQASRSWNIRFDQAVRSFGFLKSPGEPYVYKRIQGAIVVFLVLYVDDILLIGNNIEVLSHVKSWLNNQFEMKDLGEANYILGLPIKQCLEGIYISQSKYTKELLKKFGIDEGRTLSTQWQPMSNLTKTKGKSVDESKYRGMIGSLLYLTASRPDILHAVCLCARFQSNPKESHMSAVKRIFRYLKGTIQYGLFYPKNENFSLKGYSDSDYAGNIDDRKSTSGSCQFLGDCLVSWFSKKQNCVSLSTAEAEYISAAFCCTQLLWMKQTLADYKCSFENVPIFCDNISAINIAQNPVHHNRTKHIEIRHHFLRDCVSKRKIEISFVPSQDQLADIFTKPLSSETFASIRSRLGIMHIE